MPVMALTVTWAATLTLPSRSSVLAVMNSVANFAQHRYPPTAEAYWDDGVYHLGVIALYNVSHDTDVLADTETFGVYNTWVLDRGGSGNRHSRLAAEQSGTESYYASPEVIKIIDTREELSTQTTASFGTVTSGAYFSVDSQFMALPAFALLGKLDDEGRYFGRMLGLFNDNKPRWGYLTQRRGFISERGNSSAVPGAACRV
jgi:hypothetical protein